MVFQEGRRSFNDRYVTFLLDQIIPRVTERYSITENPDH
ncbi:hypothetical protein CLV30_103327 [Haloactinopolyspora alba]|uniref:Uncharacterized protein n=1 Tax=Haloactinopolyspora alba TaxID=648780 RepID=A0A2P8E9L4_9ACTN|nr:hypothetical protein CLV30_103327 [Haloactinopolyspora alba]